MHAVVVSVTINDEDSSMEVLRSQVVPRVSGAPGFVAGYWTRKGNSGLSMTIWESEDAANAGADMARQVAPEGVTVENVEVREVAASA
jgi:heme-degrading monooxygenase HmoA